MINTAEVTLQLASPQARSPQGTGLLRAARLLPALGCSEMLQIPRKVMGEPGRATGWARGGHCALHLPWGQKGQGMAMPARSHSPTKEPSLFACAGFWMCTWGCRAQQWLCWAVLCLLWQQESWLWAALWNQRDRCNQWDRCKHQMILNTRNDLSYMSSRRSGRSLPECRTHVFQLNSRYPAGEMCFPELWPYATYPASTYHIMFHLHRIWHCIKQSALSLNAYTSSHKTKPSCWNGRKSKCLAVSGEALPQKNLKK